VNRSLSVDMKKTIQVWILGVLVLLLGFIVGRIDLRSDCPALALLPAEGSFDKGFESGLEFAKRKLAEDSPMLFQDQPLHEVRRATLKSIDGKNVTVELRASVLDFLKDGMTSRSVTISDNTLLERHTQKPIDEFMKENSLYVGQGVGNGKNINKDSNPADNIDKPAPPLPYIVEKIGLGDLKIGDIVDVHTASNLRTANTVVADSIFVDQPLPTSASLMVVPPFGGEATYPSAQNPDRVPGQPIPVPTDSALKEIPVQATTIVEPVKP
jgi:hypothetical protein